MRAHGGALLAVVVILAAAAPAAGLDSQKTISQFTHTSWSAKDGIPGPVRAIAQTPDGYLWLGTEAGLYRFDGLRFAPIEPGAVAGHQHSQAVWSLCAARDGSLWIGFGSGGVGRLQNGRVIRYSSEEGAPEGGILSIVEDSTGVIWAGGQYAFGRFENGAWRPVGKEMGYLAPGAQVLLVDSQGALWAATDGRRLGITSDPVRSNTILTLAPHARSFATTDEAIGMVWTMAEAPDGHVWLADTSGRKIRQVGTPSSSDLDAGGEPITLGFDRESVWIGLIEGGIRRSIDDRESRQRALDSFYPADGLSGGLIYSSLKDREGNLWFGTGGGLDRFRENKVTSFSAREGLDPDQQIALTSTSDGSVWIVSYTRDAVRRYRDGRFDTLKLQPYSQTDSTRILAIQTDRSNHIWVGGSFGIAREDEGRFSYRPNKALTGLEVEAIGDDSSGSLWVTAKVGRVLRIRGSEVTEVTETARLPKYRCRVVHLDPRGRMWFGFEDGEVAVEENAAFRVYSSKDGLPEGRVLTVGDDRTGRIWVGGDGGLSALDGDHFVRLTHDNGLPGDSVSAILEDEAGNFWLAGPLGILEVNPQELEKALASSSYRMQGVLFDGSDGLRGLPRQKEPFPTAARAADGRLWFATTAGVAVIDPRGWHKNTIPPPVTIEGVHIDDRLESAADGLRIGPHPRNLEFQYAALSLSAPERVRFRHRLDGYDTDWRGPSNARSAAYTNLPPGDYTFRVIACNNDGLWNQTGAAVRFTIVPAFPQTRSFLLLCIAAAGSLAWAGLTWRMRRMRSILRLQFEERLAERTRIAQQLHDTLLQDFVSASMHLHVAVGHMPEDSPDKAGLNRALELVRTVTEEGRRAVIGLRSSTRGPDDLEQAFSRVREELDVRKGIEFRIIGEGQTRPLQAITRDEIYWIGREALVNAFRHSDAKHVEVEVEFAMNGLRVAVRDDGRGMDPQTLRTGREGHWGILGMRERADRIGARLKIWSRAGGGTEVELFVPAAIAFEMRPRRLRGVRRWLGLLSTRPGPAPDPGSKERKR